MKSSISKTNSQETEKKQSEKNTPSHDAQSQSLNIHQGFTNPSNPFTEALQKKSNPFFEQDTEMYNPFQVGNQVNPFLGNNTSQPSDVSQTSIQRKERPDSTSDENNLRGVRTIDSTAIQMKSELPIQRDRREVTLPEQLGAREEGPVSVRGRGDAHAFSPNDVNQGSIGDCYFLASLVAVANNNPGLLSRAITENEDGTYSVKLYEKVQERVLFWTRQSFRPVTVILYPTFPITASGTDKANPNASANPAHAHGGDSNASGTELWVKLFEKAYAILLGSYRMIGNGGFGANALETLTGRPYREEVLGSDTKQRIIEMVNAGIPVEVATNSASWNSLSTANATFARDNSIVAGHSYAVMAASESNITVRNPWGTGARNAEPTMTWAQFSALFWQFSNRL